MRDVHGILRTVMKSEEKSNRFVSRSQNLINLWKLKLKFAFFIPELSYSAWNLSLRSIFKVALEISGENVLKNDYIYVIFVLFLVLIDEK